MRILALPLILFVGSHTLSQAAGIFAPGDTIVGGRSDGTDFVSGSVGFGFNQWPGGEPPSAMIDGQQQKYLNFGKEGTGVIITPAGGTSIARQITLWTANDAVERDPASVSIYGTNGSILGGSNSIASFTPIALDLALALPATRSLGPASDAPTPDHAQTLGFANAASYTSYMIIFPTLENTVAANSMQIAEIQLDTTAIPEPGSTSLLLLGLATLLYRRKR